MLTDISHLAIKATEMKAICRSNEGLNACQPPVSHSILGHADECKTNLLRLSTPE
jgi:hypothetical protein